MVSSDKHIVSDLIVASSNTIFFHSSCCLPFNSFNYSCVVMIMGSAVDAVYVLRLYGSISIFLHY